MEHQSTTEEQVLPVQTIQSNVPVSFDNINPTQFQFSLKYQCAKSAVGQVIQGFNHLSKFLKGTDDYVSTKKEAINKFQEYLYPKMAELCESIVIEYIAKFVVDIDDALQKQVFGANLNGVKNDGQLNKFIPSRGISNKFLRYEYAQFGQLLNLLHYRLTFISMRDSMSIKRYAENVEELAHFETLKTKTRVFCDLIKGNENSFFSRWETIVTEARNENGGIQQVTPVVRLTRQGVHNIQRGGRVQHIQQVVRQGERQQGQVWQVVRSRVQEPSEEGNEQFVRRGRGRGRGGFGRNTQINA